MKYYENDKEHGTASIYQIINAVADVSNNWTLGTGRYNLNPTNVVATSAGRTFIIGSSNPSGQWVGDVDTNWFNCANWSGLAVPDANTDVIITTSATNVARVDYTAAYSDIYTDLAEVEGVQSVVIVEVENKWDADLGYSGNVYDIEEATKNDIIYPSMDPAVFEVKFPDSDIKGKVTTT